MYPKEKFCVNSHVIKKIMLQGIIFDYGGTIDSRGEHWSEVIWRGWQAVGISVDKTVFRDCYVYAERALAAERIILPGDDFLQLMRKKVGVELSHLIRIRPGSVDAGHIPVLAEDIAACCDASARECISEARPVLEALSARFPMVLVSNFYGNVDSVLRAYDLRRYFRGVIESAVVGVRKPDPRIFMLGVVALGLQPEQVLVVGDSLRKDILPAQSIGCKVAWLKGKGWTPEEDAATHPSQISSLRDLAAL